MSGIPVLLLNLRNEILRGFLRFHPCNMGDKP